MHTPRPLPKGIYTPLPTFFDDNEELDLDAFQKHVKFTAAAGTIPVIAGSMGEAAHLSHDERCMLITAARATLDESGLSQVPIVVGAGATSTRESIEIAKKAAASGADCVMVIPPGYYAGPLTANREALKGFFVDIAEASPVPVMMYNFPGVSGGIDMDSDMIIDIAKAAPNVCGIKLTCASVGKLTRVTATVDTPEFQARYPRKNPAFPFQVIDGYIDILLPSMASGASGAISGLPNFAPKVSVRLWELCQSLPDSAAYAEARRLQNVIALADGYLVKIGIAGMKMLLHRKFGYPARPRRPLLAWPDQQQGAEEILDHELIRMIMVEEGKLGDS